MPSKITKPNTSAYPKLMSIGLDIGKDVFHLIGFDHNGKVVLRRKFRRLALDAVFEKLPRCIVGMEACLSAHFVSRRLRALVRGAHLGALRAPPLPRQGRPQLPQPHAQAGPRAG